MMRRQLVWTAGALLACLSTAAGAALPTVAATSPEPVRSFGMAGLVQAAFGLAMVLALIFLCGWAARRLGLRQPGNGRLLRIVSSTMVGQRERVVVVEVGGSWLVLGVAAGQVRALHTMPAESLPDAQAMPATSNHSIAGAFSQRLLESLGKVNQLKKRDR
jgi:flagellar protein FliO/FliZ